MDNPTRSQLAVIQTHAMHPELMADTFNEANFITATALMVFTRITSFRIPDGMLAFVGGMAVGVNDPSDYDALVWALRVDGAGIPGFDDIRGPFGDVTAPVPMFVPILGGKTVEVLVRNTLNNAITNVAAAITGRYFSDTIPQELLNIALTQAGRQ